jgi:alpha-L-arabinofuranosidase
MLRLPQSVFNLKSFLLFGVVLLMTVSVQAQQGPHRLTFNAGDSGPTINRHIYGHFAEHLGRSIYGGFWVRGDDGAWRLNEPVIEALRGINPPNIRWPGGCFADYYHWQDGIGPRAERPTVVNAMWGGVTEDNSFGTHEFMSLVEVLGAEAIVVGNVGSGTVQQLAQWWEYMNHPGPSPMADLRHQNGRAEPWNVRFWGVGNESWGCGGHMRPQYYAHLFRRYATYLHAYDGVQPFRIATGPDATLSEGLVEWTEVLMREAGQMIDGLDMHFYTWPEGWHGRTLATEFTEDQWIGALAEAMRVEEHIETVSAIMDRYDPEKRVWLIVGEWGMWHQVEPGTEPGFLYQQNTLRDALVAALSLNIFNRHADRVQMANLAQTINVLQAVILTERDGDGIVLTPTYHVFKMFKGHQDAHLLPLTLEAGTYTLGNKSIPALSASASRKDGRVLLTIANFDHAAPRTVEASLGGQRFAGVTGRVLTAGAMNAHNTFARPDAVTPVDFDDARLNGDRLTIELPPMSVVALTLE